MATREMDELADRYANRGVTSVFLYTREAHPGEVLGHHQSMDDKRNHARAFQRECHVRRRILLDDLSGTVHRRYGMLPNMTWIIGRGMLLYKSSWTVTEDVERGLLEALDLLEARRERAAIPVYSERASYRIKDDGAFRRGLERAGPKAVTEFYGDPRPS